MSDSAERWIKVLGLGLVVWLLPLLAENAIFYLQMYSEHVYNSIMILFGVGVTLVALVVYLPGVRTKLIQEGWLLGIVWLVLCWAGDCGFFYFTQRGQFDLVDYVIQDGWLHSYIVICAAACGYLAHAVDARSTPATNAPSVLPIR